MKIRGACQSSHIQRWRFTVFVDGETWIANCNENLYGTNWSFPEMRSVFHAVRCALVQLEYDFEPHKSEILAVEATNLRPSYLELRESCHELVQVRHETVVSGETQRNSPDFKDGDRASEGSAIRGFNASQFAARKFEASPLLINLGFSSRL